MGNITHKGPHHSVREHLAGLRGPAAAKGDHGRAACVALWPRVRASPAPGYISFSIPSSGCLPCPLSQQNRVPAARRSRRGSRDLLQAQRPELLPLEVRRCGAPGPSLLCPFSARVESGELLLTLSLCERVVFRFRVLVPWPGSGDTHATSGSIVMQIVNGRALWLKRLRAAARMGCAGAAEEGRRLRRAAASTSRPVPPDAASGRRAEGV